jgi:hypothetical protein
MEWMKLYDTELFDETSELSDKQFRLYLRMMSFQFRHQVGFTTPLHCVQVMGITLRSAPNVEAIMTALGDVVDGKWWASGVHFQLLEKAAKSDKQRAKGLLGGRPKKSRSFPLEKPEENRIEENRVEENRIDKETNKESENVFSDFENEKEKPENQTHSLNENGSVASLNFKNAPPPKKINPDLFVEHAEAMRDFWEAYPKATKRRPMENAFLQEIQYDGVTPERLVERAKAYAQKVKHEEIEPRFIPDPYKWLENGQYDDRTLDEFMNRPVTAKEKNAGLLEHEILLKEKTLYHKPSGKLLDMEGAEAKKTQYGFYVMRFADGLIAHLGHLEIPHPSLLKGA